MEKKKEVITFFGAESKVGTTMLAQSVAEELASKGKNCLLIFASSEVEDNFLKEDDSHVGLDNLLNIDPDSIEKQHVDRVITKSGGIEYIKGTERPLKIRYFSEKLIKKITELADYNYIIIDGGSNYHYPLPISSLFAATKTCYVLTQDLRAVSRFNNTMSLILNAPALKGNSEKNIIINKYAKNSGVYTPDMIKEMFGLNISLVPRINGAESCEANKTTLYKINRTYKASITSLVNNLCGEVQNGR